jgi:flagellar hook-associated protein 3 FlgL
MRITNKMMTNNMMNNINKNKNMLNILDQQYSTGKKIQRPSEDPIVAVRALKLRTSLSELNQYYEKNIPDAMSWMDITESALKNIKEIITKINSSCVDGASDTLTAEDRNSISQVLDEMKKQIYQEGNTNYAGRYVFTGYKTDTSLIFNDAIKSSENIKYTIKEIFDGSDIEAISKVIGNNELKQYIPGAPETTVLNTPSLQNVHRIRLSYDSLAGIAGGDVLTYQLDDGSTGSFPINSKSVTDADAYNTAGLIAPDAIHFIKETGELILSDEVYNTIRQAKKIEVSYDKEEFKKGDLRPEHYFECTKTTPDKEVKYTPNPEGQKIQYEVNFSQKLTINTEGKDAIKHSIGRTIDEIQEAIRDVTTTETKIEEVKKLLAEPDISEEQKAVLDDMLEKLNTELVLKTKVMRDKFNKGMKESKEYEETVNIATSDLGSRYVRLELTEDRLGGQQVDFTDLMSKNEDVNLVETIIQFNVANNIYNASLSAASKIVQNSLLNFL